MARWPHSGLIPWGGHSKSLWAAGSNSIWLACGSADQRWEIQVCVAGLAPSRGSREALLPLPAPGGWHSSAFSGAELHLCLHHPHHGLTLSVPL
jgi:hypothetical protein